MDVLFKENNIFYNVLCFLITENEKLFDRSDAKLYWRTVSHILIIYHHAFVGLSAENLGVNLKNSLDLDLQMLQKFGSAYLTGWNVLFQTGFLFLALIHDILEWTNKKDSAIATKIRYWRDVVFSGLVVPYTCFVFTMFWSLYAIDRELVFPRVYDAVVPWWFNHCVHTNIMVLLAVETLLQRRRKPRDRRLELTFVGIVGIGYAIVYYSIYFFAGRWLYNVFGIMNWWQVSLFQILIWFSSYVFYELQFPINRLVHGKGPEEPIEEPEQNGEHKNREVNYINEVKETNGELKKNSETKNGEIEKNGEIKNGEIEKNGEIKNGETEKNGLNNGSTDFKVPPFSTKSWSLKYRTIRSQFENSSL